MTDNEPRAENLLQSARLRAALGEKGWTQTRLAKETGFSQGNISRWLKGTPEPSGDVLNKLFAAIGQTVTMAAVDGALGIQGRTAGKLLVVDPMAEPMPVEWIIDLFVARGFLTMIAGEPGAGKSMLTQTLAERLVSGAPDAFGFKLRHRFVWKEAGETCDACGATGPHSHKVPDSRVLVLDAENAPNIIQQRAQDMGLSPEVAARYIACASEGFDIYKDRKDLDAMLADFRDAGTPVDLLVIDSFTSMWLGNENVGEQVQGVLKFLNGLAQKFNLGILLIHHTDKAGEDYRGHSSIAATIGGGVFLFTRYDEKDGEDFTARHLACRKMRIAAEPTPRKVYLTSRGVADEPETSADRVALSVAQLREKLGRDPERCNCVNKAHNGQPCPRFAADDTGRCLNCYEQSH